MQSRSVNWRLNQQLEVWVFTCLFCPLISSLFILANVTCFIVLGVPVTESDITWSELHPSERIYWYVFKNSFAFFFFFCLFDNDISSWGKHASIPFLVCLVVYWWDHDRIKWFQYCLNTLHIVKHVVALITIGKGSGPLARIPLGIVGG